MENFNVQMEKLKKLQKKGLKQADKINQLARKQLQEIDIPEYWNNIAHKSMQDLKGLDFNFKVGAKKRKWKKYGVIGLVLVVVAMLFTGAYVLYHKIKSRQENTVENYRYDFTDYNDEDVNESFNFDQASLEELEEALLKVENEIKEVEKTIKEHQE